MAVLYFLFLFSLFFTRIVSRMTLPVDITEKTEKPLNLTRIEKIAYRYLARLAQLPARDTETLHLLTDEEVKTIRGEVRRTLFLAALFGIIGVLALYLPQYYFPEYFYEYLLVSPFSTYTFKLPVVSMIYGIILVYIEIYALMAINIRAVFRIAEICGFPDRNDPDYDKHLESLMRVGLERDDKSSATYGLNPLQGASRWTLLIFLIISRLKATISNYVAKIILKRILGRYALREIIDMVGIPVFAFWNAYASWVVIHETKVRIMAPNLIRQLCRNLHNKYKNRPEFSEYIYDTLQYIAMSKRRYHHNHFLLAKNILFTFTIPVKEAHSVGDDYFQRIKEADPEIQEGIIQLLLLGFIIDGNLSTKEKEALVKLHDQGIIPYHVATVKTWIRSFVKGKGLDELLNAQHTTGTQNRSV